MQETDIELLKLAAKAVGMVEYKWCDLDLYHMQGMKCDKLTNEGMWNPLTDDGDALRLVVQLEMRLEISKWVITVYYGMDKFVQEAWHNGDPYIAANRAIVRAAAEIGRNLK